jgi:hypothetical protein
MKYLLFLVSLFLFLSLQVFSQVTINVPVDYTTIQAAINAANNGDIVLVAEGTYYENINFMGKAITVASHFWQDNKERHIFKTIINGSQPVDPDHGSVVTFASGEDTNSVLCGFTITGGTGTLNINPGFPPIRRGGGIFFAASGAKIIHNIVVNNKVENEFWCFGGGLSSGPPFIPTFIILEENVFRDNECNGFDAASGGGAALGSSGRIVNNVFDNNTIISIDGSASGGGLEVQSFPGGPNEVFVKGNVFTHNKALQQEGATYWLGGCGGGISIILTKGVIENNIIQHNKVSAVNSSFSPGILFDFPPDEVYFRNNIVSHNTYSGAGVCYGGGFAIWDGNPTIENNLFEKNDATLGGGGWIGDAFSFAKIINNTIIKNHADMKGGAIYTKSAAPTVMNSILWNNHAPEGSEIYVESGTIDVTYSDVMGGWTGTGNINANPKLISLFSLLNHNSPCIDAGNPDLMYNDPQSSIFPGYAKFPARGTVRNDMGAFGGPYADGWWNFFNFRKEMESAEFEEEIVSSSTLGNISFNQYPNPFNPSTKITYTLPEAANVSLQVFDILGNEVTTLVNEAQQPGAYEFEFDGSGLASGMYLCRIQIISANGTGQTFVETRKMLLLK